MFINIQRNYKVCMISCPVYVMYISAEDLIPWFKKNELIYAY